jgi:cholesterol oxidase
VGESGSAPNVDFDAVVIGSGFGGAVAAVRMLECAPHLRVLMLERGLPYPPGSFPRTPSDMGRSFWAPGAGLYGPFDMWSFAKVRALVASGLGGGSLIYANVLMRKPAETFGADAPNGWREWPITADELAEHYGAILARLAPVPLPNNYHVPKTRHFMEAARAAGLEPELAQIAVSFSDGGPAEAGLPISDANLHHRYRRTCNLEGRCNVGCNQGAKNSLDYNYLTLFQAAGGTIRTCCEAVRLRRLPGSGYEIRYVEHAVGRRQVQDRAERERRDSDLQLLDEHGPGRNEEATSWTRRVTSRVVVLAAGSLGSTRLLLASRPGLPRLSPELGRRFSLNGDLLTVARNCRGPDSSWRELHPSIGPVITAVARHRDGGHDLWIEDAGGPEFSEWLWQGTGLAAGLSAMGQAGLALVRGRPGGRVGDLLARCFASAAPASSAMLPLLTMGRDASGGRLRLQADGLELDWDPNGPPKAHFDEAERIARRIAERLGGKLGPPGFTSRSRGLTVHPLGGCAMGTEFRNSVVDPFGEVHNSSGLFVADGAVLPGPVGPNPGLTIAAIARRIGGCAAQRASAMAGAPT